MAEAAGFEVPEPERFVAQCERIRGELDDTTAPLLDLLASRWRVAFERFGHDARGELSYRTILLELRERVVPKLALDTPARHAAGSLIATLDISPTAPAQRSLRRPRQVANIELEQLPDLQRPIFILSAPRSGSTLLFDLLARSPELWTIGGESHEIIRAIPSLHPSTRGYASDSLSAEQASPDVVAALHRGFAVRLVDHDGRSWQRSTPIRLLEKTPANALRVPFLRAAFPDALFVHLVRDPRPTISSLVEGWRSRKFVAYRDLPGWPHREWSFLLPPGWQDCAERSLVEIAALQWRAANQAILTALAEVPTASQLRVRFEALVDTPAERLAEIGEFAGLRRDAILERGAKEPLPLSRVTLSLPDPDKWRRHERELERLLPTLELDGLLLP